MCRTVHHSESTRTKRPVFSQEKGCKLSVQETRVALRSDSDVEWRFKKEGNQAKVTLAHRSKSSLCCIANLSPSSA